MANIDSKYDSNSIQGIIQYLFFRNIQFRKLLMNLFPRKFNSKIDSKIWILLDSIQQNIQLENQGIAHHYQINKTKCQLCKRVAGQILLLSSWWFVYFLRPLDRHLFSIFIPQKLHVSAVQPWSHALPLSSWRKQWWWVGLAGAVWKKSSSNGFD